MCDLAGEIILASAIGRDVTVEAEMPFSENALLMRAPGALGLECPCSSLGKNLSYRCLTPSQAFAGCLLIEHLILCFWM